MKKVGIFWLTLICAVIGAGIAGAATGDFTTRQDGNWNANTTWLKYLTGTVQFTNGSTAVTGTSTLFTTELAAGDVLMLQASPGTVRGTVSSITDDTHLTLVSNASATASGAYGKQATPTSSDGVITINGHTVTVTANVTVDQVVCNTGSALTINSGVTLTIANGSGDDLTETNTTITVNGTLIINSGATLAGGGGNGANTGSLTVGSNGTLTVNGNIFKSSTIPITLAVNGSASVAGSITSLRTITINSGGSVSVSGNISLETISDLTVASGGTLSISGTGTVAGNRGNQGDVISVYGTVSLSDSAQIGALGSGTMTVYSAGTLELGPNTSVTGNKFVLSSGGNIKVGSHLAAAAPSGNVLTTTRTYSTGANYTYNGSSSQYTGDGLPTTVNDFSINNSSGVDLTSGMTVSGTLTLTSGALSIGTNTLTINGAISTTSGSLTGGASSYLTVGGSGASTTLPGVTNGLNSLTLNRANGISLGGDITVSGTLTLTSGALSIGANTLTINGAISTTSGSLTGGASSNITFGGSGASTSLPAVTNGLNNLTINRANGISLGGSNTVAGTLTLTSGALSIGAYTLTINGAISTTSGSLTGGASSNITFGGSGATTALPAVANGLNNLTINRANGISLGSDNTCQRYANPDKRRSLDRH